MKQITKLEKGGWTLSLRKMAIDVMDKMILRPVTILVSDPRNGNINTFQGIRDKLMRKKYAYLSNWREDVLKVFAIARNSNDQLINDICTELEQFFNKKYSILEEFSEFRFRDALSRLLGKEIADENDINEEKTEEIANQIELHDNNQKVHADVQGSQINQDDNNIPEIKENQNNINENLETTEVQNDNNSTQNIEIQESQLQNDSNNNEMHETQDNNIQTANEIQENNIQQESNHAQEENKNIQEETNNI